MIIRISAIRTRHAVSSSKEVNMTTRDGSTYVGLRRLVRSGSIVRASRIGAIAIVLRHASHACGGGCVASDGYLFCVV